MKVVILCGGKGTRMREETQYVPKPMVVIGDRPILWHIMKSYAHYGYKEFVLCLGYKGDVIRDYFMNYLWRTCDVTMSLGKQADLTIHDAHGEADWRVTMAETGLESATAFRVKAIQRHLGSDDAFLLTYGDGVGNIDIAGSVRYHQGHGKCVTITGVRPPGRFGELQLDPDGSLRAFVEKPQIGTGYINGGYMVCNRAIFDFLPEDPTVMLENEPLERLTELGQLAVFRHDNFWRPMDTYREYEMLNQMWLDGTAAWKVW